VTWSRIGVGTLRHREIAGNSLVEMIDLQREVSRGTDMSVSRIHDPVRLAEAGDWIVDRATGAELLDGVEMLAFCT